MISNTRSLFHICRFCLLMMILNTLASAWENEVEIHPADLADVDARIHEAIETAGILVNEPILEKHLNELTTYIADALPGTVPPYRVRIIKSSELNAFSLADGTIYISLGMFGIIDNDAQLAMLLAHEISHIDLDHHRKFRYELDKNAAINGLWGGNTPYNLRTALSGFSIAQEQAADSSALSILEKRGFNAWIGMSLLNTMYIWLEYKERTYDSTIATHPGLSTRYNTCKNRLIADHIDSTKGFIGDSSYLAAIRKHQRSIVNLLQQSNCVNELYAMTKSKIDKYGAVPDWHYLRGSIMERFDPVDSFTIARNELDTAMRMDPSFIFGLRDLGWLFLKNKQYDSARACLSQYLIHNPHARDSSMILFYLESINE